MKSITQVWLQVQKGSCLQHGRPLEMGPYYDGWNFPELKHCITSVLVFLPL